MSEPADLQAEVYTSDPSGYDALVSAEDVDGNLLAAVLGEHPLDGSTAVEAGAGTGRITRLLSSAGIHVAASDRSTAMLAAAASTGLDGLVCADAVALPFRDDVADLTVAGWVFAHFRVWLPDGWRDSASLAVGELRRCTRSGGRVVVVESLGTGVRSPGPPTPELEEFHEWLEDDQHLECEIIQTDYEFRSASVAAEVMGAFFGAEFAADVAQRGSRRIPEFTGVWSTQLV